MRTIRTLRYLVLLLLFGYYFFVCVFCAHQPLQNDECRYAGYAHNLTEGFYAPADTKMLWNGPGYPLFLSVFVFFDIPIVTAKYCNALFLLGAVLFIYGSVRVYTTEIKALLCALLFGLYPPLLPELPRVLTESMSVFLISGLAYFTLRTIRDKRIQFLIAACLFGAYLILTKVFYAYVITAGILCFSALSVWRQDFLRSSLICIGCLILCLPYLIYTYSLTGKFFYWANSGGSTLYWMSSPYANEWGDWRNEQGAMADERYSPHHPFLKELITKNYVERDAMFKKKALENIRQHPQSYAINWIANQGRFWLDYPFAYKYQRPHTLFYMVPNALLMGAIVFTLPLLITGSRRLPAEILTLCLLAFLFIAGSSLVYSCARYLVTIVPVLLVVVFYTWTSLVTVTFRNDLR